MYENKICGSAQGSDPLSACMGVTAPTQRLPPHRIGRLYRLPGPFASISHLGCLRWTAYLSYPSGYARQGRVTHTEFSF